MGALRSHFRPELINRIDEILIFEPLGFARLWQLTKERLRLWPFSH